MPEWPCRSYGHAQAYLRYGVTRTAYILAQPSARMTARDCLPSSPASAGGLGWRCACAPSRQFHPADAFARYTTCRPTYPSYLFNSAQYALVGGTRRHSPLAGSGRFRLPPLPPSPDRCRVVLYSTTYLVTTLVWHCAVAYAHAITVPHLPLRLTGKKAFRLNNLPTHHILNCPHRLPAHTARTRQRSGMPALTAAGTITYAHFTLAAATNGICTTVLPGWRSWRNTLPTRPSPGIVTAAWADTGCRLPSTTAPFILHNSWLAVPFGSWFTTVGRPYGRHACGTVGTQRTTPAYCALHHNAYATHLPPLPGGPQLPRGAHRLPPLPLPPTDHTTVRHWTTFCAASPLPPALFFLPTPGMPDLPRHALLLLCGADDILPRHA